MDNQHQIATLKALADCPSHSRTDVRIRDLTMVIDEPVIRGGTNLGPTPTDTILAALIACTNVIGHKCAQSLELDLGNLTIAATCEFDRRGVTLQDEIDLPFISVHLDIAADGALGAADLDRVATEARRFCPVSKLLESAGTRLTTQWRKA